MSNEWCGRTTNIIDERAEYLSGVGKIPVTIMESYHNVMTENKSLESCSA